ncbi:MAG TPA: hypothetical protein VIM12_14450 [Noviherbaspirillum sp.]|jgi:hypothetical protein|uniref:hypothetical protein n=1 Tax=Noviherbaspirillum sp. TaxID=1926288 RepID=UPI002F9284D2
MNNTRSIPAAILTCALAACSTPQAALDQANHGVALVSQMELELKAFRKAEAHSEKLLVESIERQRTQAVRLDRNLRVDDLARQAAGDARAAYIISNMTALVQGLAESEAEAIADQKAINAALGKLLLPLPSTAAAITETQRKFADMGKELSWSKRQDDLKPLAEKVRESVRENKKRIDEAASAASPDTATP